MVIQKYEKINNITKNWILSLLKILIKNGNFIRSSLMLNKLLNIIQFKYKNLNKFFYQIDKNICLPVNFITKRIAGKNVLIPYRISKNKEIIYSVRLIINTLNNRNEKNFFEKLLNELIDIYNNKGFSIIKKKEICKEIKNNSSNLRFLK